LKLNVQVQGRSKKLTKYSFQPKNCAIPFYYLNPNSIPVAQPEWRRRGHAPHRNKLAEIFTE